MVIQSKPTKTKTVRFDPKELALIQNFLKANSFLDFSTLVRISVLKFIKNPDLEVRGGFGGSK